MNPSGGQDGSHHDVEIFPFPTLTADLDKSLLHNAWMLGLPSSGQKGAKGESDIWQISRQPQGSYHSSEETAETIQREAALLSEETETVPINVAAIEPLGFERMDLDVGILKQVLQMLRNTYLFPSYSRPSELTPGGYMAHFFK